MKSIIIIIAIFLVTLTAKADWVKTGELDSLYLGDAPITFSKYSPDYTKFVTYCAQDSTLRLWDLGTGKVIKERTFEWAYKYDVCEFDFESEMFMFGVNEGEFYPGSINTNRYTTKYLWFLNFKSSINYITAIKQAFDMNVGTSYYFNTFIVKNSQLEIHYFSDKHSTSSGLIEKWNEGFIQRYNIKEKFNKTTSLGYALETRKNSYDKGFFAFLTSNYSLEGGYMGQPVNKYSSRYGMYIDFGDEIFQYNDFNSDPKIAQKYPYFKKKFEPLDVEYNHFAFHDSAGVINIYSKTNDYLTNAKVPFNIKEIRKFKLIKNQRYSAFFKDTNQLLITDNQDSMILDTISLPEGKLSFDNMQNVLFSKVNQNLYKVRLNQAFYSFADIRVDKRVKFTGEELEFSTIIPDNISNYKVMINDSVYYQVKMKVKFPKGKYNGKIFYTESNVNKIVNIDSLFIVVDSLKIDYSIKNYYNNNTKYPFYLEAKTNYQDANIKWIIQYNYVYVKNPNYKTLNEIRSNYLELSDNSTSYNMNVCGSSDVTITASNLYQNVTLTTKINYQPNLDFALNKFNGFAPLEIRIIFGDTYCKFIKESWLFSTIFYEYVNEKYYKLGDSIYYQCDKSKIDTSYQTITKPGIYKITYGFGNTITHDSVITVLAPTDIQDFAERKYIFKQDADGIYCQLEGEGKVALYDNVGRLVKTYQIENERYIRKEDLERGVYFLSIQTGGEVYHEKVLVE